MNRRGGLHHNLLVGGRVRSPGLVVGGGRTAAVAAAGGLRLYATALRILASRPGGLSGVTLVNAALASEIEIDIVYNMYRMRRFTTNTVCAGPCLWALPTMPFRKLQVRARPLTT
jgi:hypothetical protein